MLFVIILFGATFGFMWWAGRNEAPSGGCVETFFAFQLCFIPGFIVAWVVCAVLSALFGVDLLP